MVETRRRSDGTFIKGASGNPRGRPRKQPARFRASHELRGLFFELGETPVAVKTAAGVVEMPMLQVVMERAFKDAAQGKASARKDVIRLMESCVAGEGEQTELVRMLARDLLVAYTKLEKYEEKFPPIRGGVVKALPDGTVAPKRYYDEALKRYNERVEASET